MPLYKRKPFALLDPPQDLDPNELVFQIRFTKEMFRDYQEYLKRLNLYRKRVWTCKTSGKTNLTYEEALVSEQRAVEKVQQFPKELMAPVLHMVQYSTLGIDKLVNNIYSKLQEGYFEGLELHGKKDESVFACKILKVLEDGEATLYEVGWLDRDKKVTGTSTVKAEDLIRKKPPLSRHMIKVFIRDSTSRNFPWVVHETLAKKHGISTQPPENFENIKKRKGTENGTMGNMKKLKRGEENPTKNVVKYPIDDLLVQPSADDPILTKRPPLSTEFRVPMDCVGDFLMVWDFCSSFGRFLHLSPFSLTDFENALCHKESNIVLIVEIHAAIFRLLIKDEGEYFTVMQNKKRNSKITLVKWTEYLLDFLEMDNREKFSSHITTIRRGHYGLLETHVKLGILRELVEEALITTDIREKLDERIEQQQALRATKREETRKKKEEQELGKDESEIKERNQKHILGNCNGKHKSDSLKGEHKGKDKDKEVEKKKPEETQNENLDREIEKLSIRTSSLGKDRNYNRYWLFRREGRLFVESSDSKQWGYYTTKEELDALIGSLNQKGVRERALKRQLEKFYQKISMALEKRTKDIAQKILLEEAVLRRSTRVRAQPRDNPNMAFLKYVNRWKET
ncbi:DDT domain-containing protein DDB_G0282237 isoform X2 [Ananas comosus]|uniref:DDT domain-containing protein DDB_G0282237 isoform X2 n=1 Tax=Ananas comosus TaxID=4615 RepID=A0A6P5GVS6_ANACO|nr:DDT domain-containing protein DDB_G0282237 isoform X2 [Ananas comosus]